MRAGLLHQRVLKRLEPAIDLVDRSEINANPADPANWEGGVWSLPPSYRGAEEGSAERARRAQIGESDRMTLLFRKRP